jgi:gliding motility-associated-like protein
MEVKVNDSLRVTLTGPYSLCAKDSGLFIATAAGGNGVYTYTWTRNPGGSIGGNNSKLKTDIAQNTDIIVTLTDGCGSPQAQKKLSVEFRPIPVAQMKVRGDSVGCSPMLVKFASLVLPSQNVKYIWNYGDNRIDSTDVDSTSHVFEYQMQNQGKYRVIMSIRLIDNGCSGRDTTTVIAMEKPHADFSYTPKEISNANPRAQFTDLSYPLDNSMINKWYWTFGDGDKDSVQNPNHEYKGSGYNQVVLIITNSVGCKDTAMKALEVGEDYKLFIPDAFTPNGDGTNDTFIAKGIGIVKFDMYIYNRWGEEIFKTDNIEKGWDGTHYNDVGKSLEDVYVYKIVVFDYLHRKHEYVGRIMLLK